MKVKKIFEEDWNGSQLKTVEHDCVDLNDAYAALEHLDGKKRTAVQYWVSDDAILTVGGNGEKFVVSAAYEIDVELYTLINLQKSADNDEGVVVGGQLGSYPSNQVVDKSMAREAVFYFCEHGKVSPKLHWQRE